MSINICIIYYTSDYSVYLQVNICNTVYVFENAVIYQHIHILCLKFHPYHKTVRKQHQIWRNVPHMLNFTINTSDIKGERKKKFMCTLCYTLRSYKQKKSLLDPSYNAIQQYGIVTSRY